MIVQHPTDGVTHPANDGIRMLHEVSGELVYSCRGDEFKPGLYRPDFFLNNPASRLAVIGV